MVLYTGSKGEWIMKIIAHRNETPGCPENSIASLEYSAQEGIYAVECDVRRTGDGQYVIYHDERTGRLAGEDRLIAEISLDEMRAVLAAAGREVITLDQLTEGYRKDTPILLHVKEHTPWPDLVEKFEKAKDMLILGVESIEMLRAVRSFMPKDRLLAFMPVKEMYPEFIREGIGIIRLWEQWLNEITPDMVHAAGAEQVWIMCWTKEKGMDGTPESLDMLTKMNADGALISDVKMAVEWMKGRR